jgi:hypothetical protein
VQRASRHRGYADSLGRNRGVLRAQARRASKSPRTSMDDEEKAVKIKDYTKHVEERIPDILGRLGSNVCSRRRGACATAADPACSLARRRSR